MTNEPLLGEVCLAIVDCEHKTVPVNESGDAWAVGTPAMVDGRIDYSKAKRIDDEVYSKWTRRMVPAEGDLILAREAPVGPVVRVPRFPRVALGQRTVLLRPNPEIVNARYLHFLLLSAEVQNRMHAKSEGSTVRHLNVEDVRTLPIPTIPSISEQERIADVLGALDEKIESNRRMVEVGSALSKAELLGASSSRSVRLGEIARVAKGLSYKGAGLADTGVPMVNMGSAANFGWLKREGFKYYTGAFKPKHLARPGDVLVVNTEQTWRNEIIGWPLLVPSDVGDVLFTHHVFNAEFKPGFEALRLPYWASLFAPRTRAMLDSMVYGTTVATLPAEALLRVEIRVPDSEEVVGFSSKLLERVWEAERETIELESLRDVLLRELLSGRLRVRDAEKVVEGAL